MIVNKIKMKNVEITLPICLENFSKNSVSFFISFFKSIKVFLTAVLYTFSNESISKVIEMNGRYG